MLEKLNHYVGILFLAAIVGGGTLYGIRVVFFGPPLPEKLYQAINSHQSHATKDLERRLQDLQEQQSLGLQNAIDVGRMQHLRDRLMNVCLHGRPARSSRRRAARHPHGAEGRQ